MKSSKLSAPKKMSDIERKFYHELWKKRKAIKDLKIRNLLRTNIELLKNLDTTNSVLF